ncbi:hypothetical protein PZE06_05900 [Robertmurraya sp. DFI.2.37]|jgi:hypothetical protein|uniref:hypothetical protein n=1 Tax=Robertmurraya sp. DFI.2.37 TaxID=3031819 RepID=UPI0012456C97|nr:hypothetical protein [Robertmurraya sp. DFI.2.37]MDF1507716.1 hypothetical protein [Robertmurraya sp. DFI.2.37]
MNKGILFLSICLITSAILTGCAYPQDKLAQNQTPYQDQVTAVQSAVEKFQEDKGGILPIKTKENDTPIYQKYLLDFKQLVPQYMAEPPGNAFESGGVFQYVLIDVETNPTVKIFDLRVAETIRDINLRISMQDYPPYKERIADGVFSLDYEQLGFKEEPVVISPYTSQELPLVINGNAEVFVDYRKDLYQILQDGSKPLQPGVDIRTVLHEDSLFVPAYSLPYTIDAETNEIIFMPS